jgi:ADP-heptose:LPS heptosyltransferase
MITILTAIDQVTIWKNKYEQLAKLYSQLRQEHLDLLSKFKSMQLKANSAQEAIDKKERIEREMKSKNLELADMIRERDRARYELDRLKGVGSNTNFVLILCRVKKTSWKKSRGSCDLPKKKRTISNARKLLNFRPCSLNIIERWQI